MYGLAHDDWDVVVTTVMNIFALQLYVCESVELLFAIFYYFQVLLMAPFTRCVNRAPHSYPLYQLLSFNAHYLKTYFVYLISFQKQVFPTLPPAS